MKNYKPEKTKDHYVTLGCIGLALICCCGGSFYKTFATRETVTAKVIEKTVKRSNNSDTYLIFTDVEVFEITDEITVGRFNSSDLYGQIHPDKTYSFEVVGWRIPFLSSYRNILKITEQDK